MSQSAPSARAWTFTLNNFTESEVDKMKSLECNYIVFGKEIGENGTPHLQGCIRFSRTYRLSGLKKNISSKAHWEPCRDFEAAVNYCMKEDPEPFIKDNRKQGQRTDLDLACETVKTSGIFGLARDDPAMFVKYHGGFSKLATMFQTPRNDRPHITWIYGDTGTGKTRQVHDKEDSLFVAHASHQWWDGYRQQDAILIDDMRASWAPFNILLKILDRYQMQVQIKGGFVELNSPRIYITSQFPPHEVYNREARSGEDIAQLLRRLSIVLELRTDSVGSTVTSSHDPEDLLLRDKEEQSRKFATGFNPATFTSPGFGNHPQPHSRRPPSQPPGFGGRQRLPAFPVPQPEGGTPFRVVPIAASIATTGLVPPRALSRLSTLATQAQSQTPIQTQTPSEPGSSNPFPLDLV